MCEPTTLAIAATAVQAFGQVSQAMQASKTAKANAQIARTNAEIKNKAAADATQRGADRAALKRQEAREATASFRARAGSTGFLADTGSSLDLQEQNAGVGEQNALTEMNNAEREAYGFKIGAMNDTNDANRFKAEGRSALTNGLLSAGGTLVTGAANYGKTMPASGGIYGVDRPVGKLPWQSYGNRFAY